TNSTSTTGGSNTSSGSSTVTENTSTPAPSVNLASQILLDKSLFLFSGILCGVIAF
ncbi:15057_t:CDS:1, partial [Acaulospora colombiana]